MNNKVYKQLYKQKAKKDRNCKRETIKKRQKG